MLALLLAVALGQSVDTPESECGRTGAWHSKRCAVVTILGRRSQGWNSTSVLGDVAQYLDTSQDGLNAVSTATTYYVRSSSANDTAAGLGAETVRIVYLDSFGYQRAMTVALNGLTGVSLGLGFSAFQWMEVETVGAAGVAAGNITISSVSGAPTVAQTVEYLASGGNRSLSGRYTVPKSWAAYIIAWDATSIGGATMDTRLRATSFADDGQLSPGVFHFRDTSFVQAGASTGHALLYFTRLPALTEVKVSAIPGAAAAGNRLDVSIHILVVEEG